MPESNTDPLINLERAGECNDLYQCMHLGYSRSKTGYVLEILEGSRQGKVIHYLLSGED
jgi:hypothetical protein